MSESKVEPEALPSTSQTTDKQKNGVFPLVSMPKIILTRLDVGNLPVPLYKSPTTKNPVKRLSEKKNKPLVSKTLPTKAVANVKHDTRFRGKPKKDYKFLSEMGKYPIQTTKSGETQSKTKNKVAPGKVTNIVKNVSKSTAKQEDNSVRGMLKKTMLQKRSKIAIPPAKKPKLMTKPGKTNAIAPKPKREVSHAFSPTLKKEVSLKTSFITLKNQSMDIDASEDDFLYDELIDELVSSPLKKVQAFEKTTNITLKPNTGNKPPTIVKGGIVKKSSLPADLKAVTSPTTLNSSKLLGNASIFQRKSSAVENLTKTPATADTPKASLPTRASPFPISINSSSTKNESKNQGKKGQKKTTKSISVSIEDPPLHLNIPKGTSKQTKGSQKPKHGGKSVSPISKPKGKPKIGPKKVLQSPILYTPVEDESDEYTEVETLENIDSEPIELLSNLVNDSTKDEDIQEITHISSDSANKADSEFSTGAKSKKDEDPHLDLLRILTDDTVVGVQSDLCELKDKYSENFHSNTGEGSKSKNIAIDKSSTHSSESSNRRDIENPDDLEAENSSSEAHDPSTAQASEESSINPDNSSEPINETVIEETPPVRTIYDLMSEVSLQYPSWNLHIIPETNAFCIAQVTKGRLGLPTLKKCIELDPDTYSAKVYIHQYHIKRFDGVYDSEDAILALIEEIHSIKA